MTTLNKPISFRSWFSVQEIRLFVFGMILSILAKGISAFTLAYAMDDILWINFPFQGSLLREVALGDGRFLYPVVADFLHQLGIDAPKAYTLSSFSMMASLVLSAQFACRIWRVEKDWLISLLVVTLVVLHPYQADIFTWKISMLTGSIPFVLTMLGLWFAVFLPRYGLALGVFSITVSLAIHQLAITFAAVVVCFSVILATVQADKTLQEAWTERKITLQMLALGLALGCYLLLSGIVRLIFPPTATFDRAKILNNIDSISLPDSISHLIDLLFFRNPLFTPLTNFGLVLLVALFAIALFGQIRKNLSASSHHKLLIVALIVGALSTAWLACAGLALLAQKGPILVRVMLAFGIMWAGIITVSLNIMGNNNVFRRTIVSIIFLLSISFIATNNQILSDQLRANQRDTQFANRIVSGIEQLNDFRYILDVVVVGTNNQSLTGLRTALDLSKPNQPQLGVVTSIFANTYGDVFRTLLLNEVTGSRFNPNITKEEKDIAESYCKYARDYLFVFFPAKGSIIRDKGLGVVCL